MYTMFPKRGAWGQAACVKAPIFQPVSAEVYMLVSPHTLAVCWPLCALQSRLDITSTWNVGVLACRDTCSFEHRVRCLHLSILRESVPLCRSSFSLRWYDSLCDSPDDACSMAQVVAKLSHHPHWCLRDVSHEPSQLFTGCEPNATRASAFFGGRVREWRHAWLIHFSSWLG